jgi:hypothetical protein
MTINQLFTEHKNLRKEIEAMGPYDNERRDKLKRLIKVDEIIKKASKDIGSSYLPFIDYQSKSDELI